MQAVKEAGGDIVAALDPNDSVGVIDSYFPDAHFFTEFERFDRHVDKLRRRGAGVDYVSICSPNYLHDAHIRFAFRSHADAVCEKPLVLNPWNLDGLAKIEQESGRRVSTILQLRLHPAIRALKQKVEESGPNTIYDVVLTYVTSRGRWYHTSWKGDDKKSGGIATNIGIHFFDMLGYVFGRPQLNVAHLRDDSRAAGYLELERARVCWFLSVDRNDLPAENPAGRSTYRSITVNDEEIEFSGGFERLHTDSYRLILDGKGFGVDDSRPSIELVAALRQAEPSLDRGELHPRLK
ncbi:MAG: Gfo/Idh/MocA family oxidoreductase [Deltaproteobacteria bacterium]|nr:Gfo/Idh/MocA family oxidoreductase [Deltaproteobacteria bacterium]